MSSTTQYAALVRLGAQGSRATLIRVLGKKEEQILVL